MGRDFYLSGVPDATGKHPWIGPGRVKGKMGQYGVFFLQSQLSMKSTMKFFHAIPRHLLI